MRCLYEVLEIGKDADETTIRKAYRKGALAWHPDKNQDNLEEADARFKEIQNAWEVLSDPREKAWYDSHREQILRAGRHQAGGDAGHEGQAPPEDISLFQYFSSSCYSGFNDGPMGFYTVYGKVFKDLGAQEVSAVEQLGKKAVHVAPGFGTADSPWPEVSAFYQAWLYFVSDRSFAWADVHNPASAPNRKVRRLMEEDNNKRRKAARREFQDNVRALVAFVRKRDVRVIAWAEQEERKRLEREAVEKRRREGQSAERMRRAAEYQEPEWVQAADAETASSEGAALVEDELYCIACDKFFKSSNALTNHNRSKKHLQNTEVLKAAMAEEEAEAHQLCHELDSHSSPDESSASAASSAKAAEPIAAHAGGVSPLQASESHLQEEEDIDSVTPESRDSSTASDTLERTRESNSDSESASALSDASLDEDAMLARMVQSHMHTGSRTKQKQKPEASESENGDEGSQCSARAAESNIRADGQSLHSEFIEEGHALQGQAAADAGNHAESATSMPSPQEGQSRKQDAGDSNSHSRLMNSSEQSSNPASKGSEAGSPPRAQAGRAGKKNLPRKARGGKRAALGRGTPSTSQGAELSCQVCKKLFDTRNSLFKHITEQGHAVPPAEQRA